MSRMSKLPFKKYTFNIDTGYGFTDVNLYLYNIKNNKPIILIKSPKDLNILYYFDEVKSIINDLDNSKSILDYIVYFDLSNYEFEMEGKFYKYDHEKSNDFVPYDNFIHEFSSN